MKRFKQGKNKLSLKSMSIEFPHAYIHTNTCPRSMMNTVKSCTMLTVLGTILSTLHIFTHLTVMIFL